MNKKIWIGLGAAFLVLVLVLGIQIMGEKPVVEPQQDVGVIPLPEDEVKGEVDIPTIDEEDLEEDLELEIDPEDLEELEESLETPGNSEPEETPEDPPVVDEKPIEKPVETPKPVEPEPVEDEKLYVTLSVSVKTLLDKKDSMNPEKWELVPKNGWIFPAEKVEFFEGESAFNVLLREMKKNKIHMEFIMSPLYNSNYIQGIGNLYEFDCGELSGWMYAVNDLSPNFGTSNYTLKDGDVVKLLYTCDLGRDLGFEFNE